MSAVMSACCKLSIGGHSGLRDCADFIVEDRVQIDAVGAEMLDFLLPEL